jgi:hypothetical protein
MSGGKRQKEREKERKRTFDRQRKIQRCLVRIRLGKVEVANVEGDWVQNFTLFNLVKIFAVLSFGHFWLHFHCSPPHWKKWLV